MKQTHMSDSLLVQDPSIAPRRPHDRGDLIGREKAVKKACSNQQGMMSAHRHPVGKRGRAVSLLRWQSRAGLKVNLSARVEPRLHTTPGKLGRAWGICRAQLQSQARNLVLLGKLNSVGICASKWTGSLQLGWVGSRRENAGVERGGSGVETRLLLSRARHSPGTCAVPVPGNRPAPTLGKLLGLEPEGLFRRLGSA